MVLPTAQKLVELIEVVDLIDSVTFIEDEGHNQRNAKASDKDLFLLIRLYIKILFVDRLRQYSCQDEQVQNRDQKTV